MNILITLVICIAVANLMVYILHKMYVPRVISLLLTGFIFGIPLVNNVVIQPNTSTIILLGDIGILLSMFIAGLESSKTMLQKEEKDSLFISIFATLTPFFLILIFMKTIGLPFDAALMIAVCCSMTAEATNAQVLLFMKQIKTKLASIILEAGLLDDLFGIVMFIIIAFTVSNTAIKDIILLGSLLVVFIIGLSIQKIREKKVTRYAENIAMYGIIPFFFINTGIAFDFSSLTVSPLFLFFLIILAIAGKVGGVMMTRRLLKLDVKQLFLIGWAMNSRGAMELVIAFMAYRNDIISLGIYSSLVIMTLVTTMIFPIVISILINKYPNIMNG